MLRLATRSTPFAGFTRINDAECRFYEPLDFHTSMKMRSVAALLMIAHTPDALRDTLRLARRERIPTYILGGGSNTLFASSYFDGLVIKLGREFQEIDLAEDPTCIRAGGGLDFKRAVSFSMECGLSGLEFGVGIPGSLGGAAAGNAGARDAQGRDRGLCDCIETLYCMDRSGTVWKVHRGDFQYTYRASELREVVILDMDLRLEHAPAEQIHQNLKFFREKRKGQPYGDASCGCVFKNPVNPATGESMSAGRIIDELGLKGYRVGDATISEKHANFMINRNQASGEDFLALISLTRDIVRRYRGIELELEVEVVGGPLNHALLA